MLKGLTVSSKPGEKSFDELKQLMLHHQNPRPNMIAERFKFNSRVRHANESVSMFVAELRKLTEYYEYGESLNDMLRDRLVCGINHERTQQRLLSEGSTQKKTLKKALDVALLLELAINQTAVIQSGYMNSRSETQILAIKKLRNTISVTEIMQPSHALSLVKSVFIVTTKVIQAKFVVKRQKQIK